MRQQLATPPNGYQSMTMAPQDTYPHGEGKRDFKDFIIIELKRQFDELQNSTLNRIANMSLRVEQLERLISGLKHADVSHATGNKGADVDSQV